MSATLIDGRGISNAILKNLSEQITALGEPIHLAAVCIGSDPGLRSFIRLKQKAAQMVGMTFSSYFFDGENENEVRQTLAYLAADEHVHGIFVELPLPQSWETSTILSLIPLVKDVDVISPEGELAFYDNDAALIVMPPAVKALEYIVSEYGIDILRSRVAVVGQGKLVGLPVTHWLRKQGVAVTTVDINTQEPARVTAAADIIIAATGVPGLIADQWVREDAIVIDYGFGQNQNGAYVGDVDFDSVAQKAKLVTPVPGGMGPLVIAATLENTLALASH